MKSTYFLALSAAFLLLSCNKKDIETGATPLSPEKDSVVKDSIEKKPIISSNEEETKTMKDTSKYYIYLTLDDGPQLPGTQNCKNILDKNDAKATFFMIGLHNSGIENNKIVDSIHNDPLFIVSNHSETHAFRNKYKIFYNSPNLSIQDFLQAENKLSIKNKIVRLPGRNTWAINNQLKGESSGFKVARKLDSMGYSVYGWDLEWRFTHEDIPVESAHQMVKEVENVLKSGKTHQPKSIVILVHDRMFGKPQYADSLRKFITTLKKNDSYIFDTLDNYSSLTSLEREKK